MRVFCPEHKRGFFAPRQNPIKCENRGHVLGELNFAGEPNSSLQLQWQYCCNCEHFSLIDFDQQPLKRCPVCTRRSSLLYLCDRCYTVSFESDTPLQTKNFSLSVEGVPNPCCPGCLQSPSADLHEHNCDDLAGSIVTPLNVCPLCNERLDVGPTFPALVADYLRKVKSGNRLLVTFDFDSALFVPVVDGEFVVITETDQEGHSVLLPRSPRLSTRRDFYELYQDYYHCAQPDAGDVYISEPAVVVRTRGGWKLLSSGVLEVVNTHPEGNAVSLVPQPLTQRPALDDRRPHEMREESVSPCADCGAMIESKYAYCWKCGRPREAKKTTSEGHAHSSKPILLTAESGDEDGEDDSEQTVQHEHTAARPQLFSWVAAEEPERHDKSWGSLLKLFGIAGAALLIGLVALFVVTRSGPSSSSASTADVPATAPTAQPTVNATPVTDPETTPPAEATPQQTSATSAEGELENLRRMRAVAKPSDHSKILQAFARTETKYAHDYRIPYERARFALTAQGKDFRQEAFAALNRAAQKAIESGKAGEMLESLRKDASGDFQPLAQRRREWADLNKALKKKNTSMLNAVAGL